MDARVSQNSLSKIIRIQDSRAEVLSAPTFSDTINMIICSNIDLDYTYSEGGGDWGGGGRCGASNPRLSTCSLKILRQPLFVTYIYIFCCESVEPRFSQL